ncbi:hypothetical protein JCM5350_004510 [Sporobolomyces pararoseus]
MRLPEDILRIVIEHLDPCEGLKTTKTLSSLCLTSKLLLELARPQLYSNIRIDDQRCEYDLTWMSSIRQSNGRLSNESLQARPAWVRTLFREKEYDVEKKEWQKQQEAKRQRGEEEYSFFYESDVFDEGDQDAYGEDEHAWPVLPKLNYRSWGPTDILDPFSYQLLFTLEAQPHLARLVKKLDFQGRIEGKPTSIIIERFLTICPNVETILLYRGAVRFLEDYPRVVGAIRRQAPNVKNLEIIDFNDEGSEEVFQGISKLSQLSHLSLTCTPRYSIELSANAFPLTSLSTRNLSSFHLGSLWTSKFYERFPSHFLESITSLGVAVRRETPDLSNFKNLRHLTITYGYTSHAINTLQTLSPVNEIRSLELRLSETIFETEWKHRDWEEEAAGEYGESEEEHEPGDEDAQQQEEGGEGGFTVSSKKGKKEKELNSMVDLLDYLPAKLEELSIPSIVPWSDQEPFAEAVKTKLLLPSIRKIFLGETESEEEDDTSDDDDSDQEETDSSKRKQKKKRKETWLDRISKYLVEEKGIEVYRVKLWDESRKERSAMMSILNCSSKE